MNNDELMEALFDEFASHQRCLWNTIERNGLDTMNELRRLEWFDLLEYRNIGPRRVLALVNFVRGRGQEWPWFGQWDEASQNWTVLQGQRREAPVSK